MDMDTIPMPYEANLATVPVAQASVMQVSGTQVPATQVSGTQTNGLDLNDADEQEDFDLIPPGTIARVRMTIKQGGYNDPARGWSARYATCNSTTGAVYLNCEFLVLEGPYAKRRIWGLIGLHSPKGPEWNRMGRAFMKGIINSAYGLAPDDVSPEAVAKRNTSFSNLNGIVFFARIDVEKDKKTGEGRNTIKFAVTKGHKGYPANGGQETHALPQGFVQTPPLGDALPAWAR